MKPQTAEQLLKALLSILVVPAESVWICNMPWAWSLVWVFGGCLDLARRTLHYRGGIAVDSHSLILVCSPAFSF